MENEKKPVSSKFLSLILRHRPEIVGLQLDQQGWAFVEDLISKVQKHGKQLDLEILREIVDSNNKKRFSFNKDATKIRANQGHSVKVDLAYEPKVPPPILYHGTAGRNVSSILNTGILKQIRHHVHLSESLPSAMEVGGRHGKPVVFEVLAGKMFEEGIDFFRSDNGVWLTDEVPVKFLKQID
ncbi:RNA 2'-phosphotransferase [Salinimicrobium xinjiangense]|uniref:RNA 2'-phosphotransferase n=1 Tax=Salinimicrobium xinjiangense TaxID=438596 RepID=UPI00041F2117|nr:RNA 2'-phosphotransferase [Salinimicrobium xinjiangense]